MRQMSCELMIWQHLDSLFLIIYARTDDEWTAYVTAQYLAGAPAADIASVAADYPSDPAAVSLVGARLNGSLLNCVQGSPFNTGSASALT